MLVLSRKSEQKIHIGDDVVITILEVKGNTVRIGIEAPRNIRVLRGELREQTSALPVAEGKADAASFAASKNRGFGSQSTSQRQESSGRRDAQLRFERMADRSHVMRFPVADAAVEVRTENVARQSSLRVRRVAAPR